MPRTELVVVSGDVSLPAVLTLPDEHARAGIVTLHPASGPSREYFLFEHLASLAAPLGIAVLSYDRRPSESHDDVPFACQAADALAAVAAIRERVGDDVPVGLWAFSQGAWAAPVAAVSDARIAFLVLVGASGVSPADQMRYSAAETVSRAGYGERAAEQAAETRGAVEALLRGEATVEQAQAAIDEVADEQWFDLLWLPRTVPSDRDASWTDMDFDPAPVIRDVRCPVLLVYGDDEAVPADRSIEVWQGAASERRDVVRLPRSTHVPTSDGAETLATVDPDYEQGLLDWLRQVVLAR